MDFSRVTPNEATPAKEAPQDALAFEVTLVEDTHDRTARPSTINSIVVPLIGLVVIAAALPLGGNRPQAWAAIAMAVAVLALIHFGAMVVSDRSRAPRFTLHWPIFAIGLLVPLFAFFQIIPLPKFMVSGVDLPPFAVGGTLSLDPSATMFAVLRCVTYALAFAIVLDVCTREARAHQLLRIIFYGISLHALWAMIALRVLGDIYFWGPKESYLGWATGTFVNRNSFATFLGMGGVVGLALILDAANRRKVRRPDKGQLLAPPTMAMGFDWVCLFLIVSTLLATGSRMGAAATFVAMAGVAVTLQTKAARLRRAEAKARGDNRRRHRRSNRLRRVIPWVFIVPILLLIGMSGDGLAERGLYVETSVNVRLTLYEQALSLIAMRPLSGVGLDNFEIAFPLVHTPDLDISRLWDLAHNTYLSNWVELGVIIGSAPVAALAVALWRLGTVVRQRQRYLAAPVAAVGVIALGALHSLVDFSLEMMGNTLLFVVIVAAGLSQWRSGAPSETQSDGAPSQDRR